MENPQNTRKKKYIIVATSTFLILLVLVALFYFKRTESTPGPVMEEMDEREIIIQQQLDELERIREERKREEGHVLPTEDEIQLQLEELESLRRR